MPTTHSWRDDIVQLIAENFHFVDSGAADRTIDLVSDDFTMTIGSMVLDRAHYIDAMQRRAQADYQTRHCFTNLRLVEAAEDAVTVGFVATVHRLEPTDDQPTVAVSDWTEEWVRCDDSWRVRSRVVVPFVASGDR
jgi:ketosteroid isomerase-like protein